MNFLFKLVALSDHPGCYYIQIRGKRLILGVLNRHRGDRSKWFWVAGAWKTVSSDQPSVGLDISTFFGEKPKRPRAPVVKNLSLDFRAVWERIRRLEPNERNVNIFNDEGYRLATRVFCFPHHLAVPVYPRIPDLPTLEKMAHNAGVLDRLRLASRTDRAPTATAHPPLEKKKRDAPGPLTERRSLEEEVPPLVRDKKRKLVEAANKPTREAPLPPIVERPSKEKAVLAKPTAPRGEPRRGRAFFGRDLENTPARDDDPNRPALVVDFLSSRSPLHESDVPNHVARGDGDVLITDGRGTIINVRNSDS
ncbi:hypothetical protein OROMI_004247 [Orobanche minor]